MDINEAFDFFSCDTSETTWTFVDACEPYTVYISLISELVKVVEGESEELPDGVDSIELGVETINVLTQASPRELVDAFELDDVPTADWLLETLIDCKRAFANKHVGKTLGV